MFRLIFGILVAFASFLAVYCSNTQSIFTSSHIDPIDDDNVKANSRAIVQVNRYSRFTVLTDAMIRMEWDHKGQFNDLPSFAIKQRHLPVPEFEWSQNGEWTLIRTHVLTVKYKHTSSDPFNDLNLSVDFHLTPRMPVQWLPSTDRTEGNLLGTLRTLDGDRGDTQLDCKRQENSDQHCTYGLLSRRGFAVVDDSYAVRLQPLEERSSVVGFPWVVNQTVPDVGKQYCSMDAGQRKDCGYIGITETQCKMRGCCYSTHEMAPNCFSPDRSAPVQVDWYFLGHGRNYKQALYDFTLVSGKIPMIPKYALGSWSSRYFPYNDAEMLMIMDKYQQHRIPLDVVIIDMDWHKTFYKNASRGERDAAGESPGWTGWTWDPRLFPNAKAFLDKVTSLHIRKAVNLHPASGLLPHEAQFEAMAKRLGYDLQTTRHIPFQSTNQTFMAAFWNLTLGPLEQDGVDFFWLDWQQGESWQKWTHVEGLNPTLWLNYVFWEHMKQVTAERPLVFHRWGGLGNHRFPIGFSGDTFPSWKALEFQVLFTVTASNVLFTYWSHDIGGHMEPSPPELYTRWVQFGAFSPVLRTHSTRDGKNIRYFWYYPLENFEAMKYAVDFRMQLMPYIYSMTKYTFDTGIGLLRPMYYEHTEDEQAYMHSHQYYFGNQMLVKPITKAMDEAHVVHESVWLPAGVWYAWHSGKVIHGSQVLNATYTLDEMPLFLQSGSIVPMAGEQRLQGGASEFPRHIQFVVFMGDQMSGRFKLYDDDGVTSNYDKSEYSMTTEAMYIRDLARNRLLMKWVPRVGSKSGLKGQRSFSVTLLNTWPIRGARINSRRRPQALKYDVKKTQAIIELGSFAIGEAVELEIDLSSEPTDVLSGMWGKYRRMLRTKQLLDYRGGAFDVDISHFLESIALFQGVEYNSSMAFENLDLIAQKFPLGVEQVRKLNVFEAIALLEEI